jgi:5-methylcytosine-specific restriction endonuclease McrA
MRSTTVPKLYLNERWALTHVWGLELSQFRLRRLGPGEADRHWKEGITPDVVDFIVNKCKCADCDSRISAPLAPCACGRASEEWNGAELAAAFPREQLEEEVKRLYTRQKSRLGSARRAAAVKTTGGKINFKEKTELFKVQEGLCFYCGESLVDQDGCTRYHCDHFVAVTNGGRSDLENSVLACARCNLLKNSDGGRSFIQRARRLQLIKNSLRLAKMRQALAMWRKSRGLRALTTLVGGN